MADNLHYGRAAAELRIAQPALSQQIQRLERSLGTTLIERTSRRVSLTDAGVALVARARLLLAESQRAVDELRLMAEGAAGRLDVGFVSSAVGLGAIDGLQAFRQCHPAVDVVLHEGFTAALMQAVGRGQLDIAIVRDPEPLRGVRLRHLTSEPFRAVLRADHPLATRRELTGSDLIGEPFVLYPAHAGAEARRLNLRAVAKPHGEPRIVQEASHWLTILYLVAAGVGVTIAPLSATFPLPPGLAVIQLDDESETTLCMATREDDRRTSLTTFYEAARNSAQAPRPTATSGIRRRATGD